MKGLLAVLLSAISFNAIAYKHTVAYKYTNEQCLANAIYHEARGESLKGKRAVLDVIKNRAKVSGKSICQVIFAKRQFSWIGKKPMLPYNKKMQNMLTEVKNHPKILLNVERWFFRKELKPKWAKGMSCRVIDKHKYCYVKKRGG